MLPRDYSRQNCSIARSMEVLADRWTLLILRDALFAGTARFDDFLERLGVARNILAGRLARLTEEGVLERIAYQDRPVRHEYRITAKGRDLMPVLVAMLDWGDRHHAPNGPPREIIHEGCGGHAASRVTCSDCGAALTARDVTHRPGPGAQVPLGAG